MSGTKNPTAPRKMAMTAASPWISMLDLADNARDGASAMTTGDFGHRALPGLDVFIVRSHAELVAHGGESASGPAGNPSFLVSLQVEGRGVVSQDGREATLGPGDFSLYDGDRPYKMSLEAPFEQIVLRLPANALRGSLRSLERLTATAVRGDNIEGRLLMEMIRTLWRDYETLEPAARLAVANGIVSLLIAGLHTLVPVDAQASPDSSFVHLERIKRLVDAQLGDPELTVTSIARQLGLSTGHLHRVFKSEAVPLAHYIWLRRLEACSRDLLDPRLAARSIGEIAYRRGFKDAAHFSRSFKERFGLSPREWRGTYAAS